MLNTVTKVRGPVKLPEDVRWVHNESNLKGQPQRTKAPPASGSGKISRTEVKERLMRGMATLRALPDRERKFFHVKSNAPGYLEEAVHAYAAVDAPEPRFTPTPRDISEYLETLSWLRHLDRSAWKIVWWRSFGLSFGLIAKQIGRSDETARLRFETAVTDAWIVANSLKTG